MESQNSSNHSDIPLSSIDFTSHKLTLDEALKCLLTEDNQYNVIVPIPNAQICNNLDEYLYKSTANARSKTPNANNANKNDLGSNGTSEGSRERRRSSRGSSSQSSQEPFAVPLVRNFERILKSTEVHSLSSLQNSCEDNDGQVGSNLDTQQSQATRRTKRIRPNVFSRAESLELNSGPFAHLKSRMGKIVKVIVRRRRKVAFISRVIEYRGRLIIFDKHMNLHLKDVIESFAYVKQGKTLKRARHRDSIVLRGDNIILIV